MMEQKAKSLPSEVFFTKKEAQGDFSKMRHPNRTNLMLISV